MSSTIAIPLGEDVTDPLHGGVLACAAVNSVLWRRGDDPRETWTSYAALVKTVSTSQPLDADRALLDGARDQPAAAEKALRRTISLRETLFEVLSAVVAGAPLSDLDLGPLNRAIHQAAGHLTVGADTDGVLRTTLDHPLHLDRPMWQIALSAAALLTGDLQSRLKQCPGPPCGWLFVDYTKNRSRRWCDPALCGNRDRVRAHYWRHKAGPEEADEPSTHPTSRPTG